jgi:hypothetical protein
LKLVGLWETCVGNKMGKEGLKKANKLKSPVES